MYRDKNICQRMKNNFAQAEEEKKNAQNIVYKQKVSGGGVSFKDKLAQLCKEDKQSIKIIRERIQNGKIK